MNCWTSHSVLLVIVDNFDTERFIGFLWPLETESPLDVDSDAELAGSTSAQSLEAIARDGAQGIERTGSLQNFQTLVRLPFE